MGVGGRAKVPGADGGTGISAASFRGEESGVHRKWHKRDRKWAQRRGNCVDSRPVGDKVTSVKRCRCPELDHVGLHPPATKGRGMGGLLKGGADLNGIMINTEPHGAKAHETWGGSLRPELGTEPRSPGSLGEGGRVPTPEKPPCCFGTYLPGSVNRDGPHPAPGGAFCQATVGHGLWGNPPSHLHSTY